jgi:hypothetical protein
VQCHTSRWRHCMAGSSLRPVLVPTLLFMLVRSRAFSLHFLHMCFDKQRERSLCLVVCRKPGSFCGLQLLSGDQLEQSACDIQALLAGSLVEDAPLQDELGWLNNLSDKVSSQVGSAPHSAARDRAAGLATSPRYVLAGCLASPEIDCTAVHACKAQQHGTLQSVSCATCRTARSCYQQCVCVPHLVGAAAQGVDRPQPGCRHHHQPGPIAERTP